MRLATGTRADAPRVHGTYAVVWREQGRPLASGELDLLPRGVVLRGLAAGEPAVRHLSYESLAAIRVGRRDAERIHGHPTVLVELHDGSSLAVATVAAPGALGELAERLAALVLGPGGETRAAIVIPIAEGSRDAVGRLLESGPPFDPKLMWGLERHEVFLTETEAVFVFETQPGPALEPLLTNPAIWRAARAWEEHLAGPPRLARSVYAWSRDSVD